MGGNQFTDFNLNNMKKFDDVPQNPNMNQGGLPGGYKNDADMFADIDKLLAND